MEQNYVFQSYLKLFNYKTYAKDKGLYFTANLISVWEKYYPLYGIKSGNSGFDMWYDILKKWYKSFFKLQLRVYGKRKGPISHNFKEPWDSIWTHYYFNGGMEKGFKFIYSIEHLHGLASKCRTNQEAFEVIKALYNNYLAFIHAINAKIKDMQNEVAESFIKAPVDHSWVESVGRFDIKKYDSDEYNKNPYFRRLYRYHPALLDTHLY